MKHLISERQILDLVKKGERRLKAPKDCLLTPLAKDLLKQYNIELLLDDSVQPQERIKEVEVSANICIAIGSDHTGFSLKEIVKKYIENKNLKFEDVGTFSTESCDYPDYALNVAEKVLNGRCSTGIMIDATGNASSIVLNKLPGIRAAVCYNNFTAWSARNHNNANVLLLGAKSIGEETVKMVIDTWLLTGFSGGRHQKRLDKISQLEEKLFKKKDH